MRGIFDAMHSVVMPSVFMQCRIFIIMLIVNVPSVVRLSVVRLSVVRPSVVRPSVVRPSVKAPHKNGLNKCYKTALVPFTILNNKLERFILTGKIHLKHSSFWLSADVKPMYRDLVHAML